MEIKDLLKEDSIILGANNHTKQEAIHRMIEKHYKCGHIQDKEKFTKAIMARESLSSTGVGNLIAMPHAMDETVNYPSIVAMIDRDGVEFDSIDQKPAKIFFMIAVPSESADEHLEIIAKLSQILMEDHIVESLLNAMSPKQFIKILNGELKIENKEIISDHVDIVAVTGCPTGIAHTYMAAKALEEAAKEMNIVIKVETNGASGIQNRLTEKDIKEAKGVIVAADKKVDIDRFNNKKMIEVPVSEGLHHPRELIEKIMSKDVMKESQRDDIEEIIIEEEKIEESSSITSYLWKIYKHFMYGISHLIPFLMFSGIIAGFSLLLSEDLINQFITAGESANIYSLLGIAVNLLKVLVIALLSAYISESISGKLGFAVGLISAIQLSGVTIGILHEDVSLIASKKVLMIILLGYASGYLVLILNKLFSKIPENLHTLIPNLLTPITSTLIISYINLNIINNIQSTVVTNEGGDFINNVSGSLTVESNLILFVIVGMILGGMMAIDMGGPINKIAYAIAILGILSNNYIYMSAVMAAGMVPPLVIGTSMIIAPKLFQREEVVQKWKCIVKGLCFVSEEALPYVKQDKKGFHIPCIIASAIAGGLSVYFGCSQQFPHGGIWLLPLISNSQFFLIVLVASVLIGMTLVICLRKTENR